MRNPETPAIDQGTLEDLKCHHFSHEAMATVYHIYIAGEQYDYASGLAREGFDLVDRLELELSRFIENSDISRINNLGPCESTRIGPDTYQCLKQCLYLFRDTDGAFDVAIGPLYECWINHADKSLRDPTEDQAESARERSGLHHLLVDPDEPLVGVEEQPVQLDLGGAGKGYAVDRVAELFREWGVESALIAGGTSTLRALKPPGGFTGWPLSLRNYIGDQDDLGRLMLCNRAVSSSGVGKGRHIIDPRSGRPVPGGRITWAQTPDAATADGLSTAAMVFTEQEIAECCRRMPDADFLRLEQRDTGPSVKCWGDWSNLQSGDQGRSAE